MSKLLSDGEVANFRERGYHFPVDALAYAGHFAATRPRIVTGWNRELVHYNVTDRR